MLSSFLKAVGDAGIPEYTLNLERGESNVNGIFAYISPSFVWEEEQVEVVVLVQKVADITDIRNDPASFSMSLLPDGGGVLVEEPSVPHFMVDSYDDLYDMNKTDTKYPDLEYACHTTHAVCMTAIQQNQKRQKNKYILKFPENVVCKMGYMNPSNGRALRGKVTVATSTITNKSKDGAVEFKHVTLRYMAVIKSKERKLLRKEDTSIDVDDLLAGMFSSVKM